MFLAAVFFSGAALSVASVEIEDENGTVFAGISAGLPESGLGSNKSSPGSESSSGIHSRMAATVATAGIHNVKRCADARYMESRQRRNLETIFST
jgi:hypothetical protein